MVGESDTGFDEIVPPLPPGDFEPINRSLEDLRSGRRLSPAEKSLLEGFSQFKNVIGKSSSEGRRVIAHNLLHRVFLGPGTHLTKPFFIDAIIQMFPPDVKKTLCEPDENGNIPLISVAQEINKKMHEGHKHELFTQEGGPLEQHVAHIDEAIQMGYSDLVIAIWEKVPLPFIKTRRAENLQVPYLSGAITEPSEVQTNAVVVSDALLRSIPEQPTRAIINFLYPVVYREMQATFSVEQGTPYFDTVFNRTIFRMVCLISWLSKQRPEAAGHGPLFDVDQIRGLRWVHYFQKQKRELFAHTKDSEFSSYGKIVMSEVWAADVLDQFLRPPFPELRVLPLPAVFDSSDPHQHSRGGDIAIVDTSLGKDVELFQKVVAMSDVTLRTGVKEKKKPSGLHKGGIPVVVLFLGRGIRIALPDGTSTLEPADYLESLRNRMRAGQPYSPIAGLDGQGINNLRQQLGKALSTESAVLRAENQSEILASPTLAKNFARLEEVLHALNEH